MLNDPSKSAQSKTRLYPPDSATSVAGGTVAGFPVRGNSTLPRKSTIRLAPALAMLSLVAIAALILGVIFAAVPLLARPKHNTTTVITHAPTATHSTKALPTPTPTATATSVPVTPTATPIATSPPVPQGTTIITGLTASPSHFAVQSDCQVDNGYRCTVTLFASGDGEDAIRWRASSSNINVQFSPTSGKLKPGKQQQVIVYIYGQCPFNGTLIFTVEDEHITLPAGC